MVTSESKQQLLERVRQERASWQAILVQVSEGRMNVPGAMGDWTFKDTVAHLTTWWRREVARLSAAQRGERPPDHPPQNEVSVINQWIHLTNRDRPLDDVLRDTQAVWQQLEEGLATTPERVLAQCFDWLEGRALGSGIVDDFVLHLHEEHEPLIRAWLAQVETKG